MRRIAITVFLLLHLLLSLPAQSLPEWVETVPSTELPALLNTLQEEEANLPPLSALSDRWLDTLEQVGEELILAGVHRSESSFESAAAYVRGRAAWAGVPVSFVDDSARKSERLIGVLGEGPDEAAAVAILLDETPERVTAEEAAESSALDALRRVEIESLTLRDLSEKATRARRVAEAVDLAREQLRTGQERSPTQWRRLATTFAQVADGIAGLGEVVSPLEAAELPALGESDGGPGSSGRGIGSSSGAPGSGAPGSGEGAAPGGELGSPFGGDQATGGDPGFRRPAESEDFVGIPEGRLLPLLREVDPLGHELLLRYDPQIALGMARFLDGYRWTLSPGGRRGELGARMLVMEREQRQLFAEVLGGRTEALLSELRVAEEYRGSEELREELLREAEGVLRRYERGRGDRDEEAGRWALLSVLSHPYAQELLFEESGELLAETQGRVEELYERVDTRARELISLVFRRQGVENWNYQTIPIASSFDRVIQITLPEDQELLAEAELVQQLSDAYYRAFNLITNPEQNQELPGRGVAQWSMLHGQYFEPLFGGREEAEALSNVLRSWFLEYNRAEEPRSAFHFAYRGYQRLYTAQRWWLEEEEARLPRRMAPIPPVPLTVAAEIAEGFLSGERGLYQTEAALGEIFSATELPPHLTWAELLSEERARYARVSRAETTALLLRSLGQPPEPPLRPDAAGAVVESRLRSIAVASRLGMIDPEVGVVSVYDAWVEGSAPYLSATLSLTAALSLPGEWREAGLLPAEAAADLYRALSARGVELLLKEAEEGENE